MDALNCTADGGKKVDGPLENARMKLDGHLRLKLDGLFRRFFISVAFSVAYAKSGILFLRSL